ncbi:hypothetical protein MLD38_034735 [Melastoma candidum]|uniref:Uncharacterized protein n=1 Tax=Melastoma candidum TaxID=119954 RepID=A0ACB9MDC7_9MYRT|nr:hypothetical protein MLD38_034735 [Melastoma candidum]
MSAGLPGRGWIRFLRALLPERRKDWSCVSGGGDGWCARSVGDQIPVDRWIGYWPEEFLCRYECRHLEGKHPHSMAKRQRKWPEDNQGCQAYQCREGTPGERKEGCRQRKAEQVRLCHTIVLFHENSRYSLKSRKGD